MLLTNNNRFGTPGNFRAGVLGGVAASLQPGNLRTNALRFGEYSSFPDGTRPPESYVIAVGEGGLAAYLQGESSMAANINADAIGEVALFGVGSAAANGFMVTERTVSMNGISSLTPPVLLAYARGAVTIRIGFQPSADENADAVMAAVVEGNVSVKKALQVLLAVAAGKSSFDASVANPIAIYRDTGDTVDRVIGTMSGSERVTVVIN